MVDFIWPLSTCWRQRLLWKPLRKFYLILNVYGSLEYYCSEAVEVFILNSHDVGHCILVGLFRSSFVSMISIVNRMLPSISIKCHSGICKVHSCYCSVAMYVVFFASDHILKQVEVKKKGRRVFCVLSFELDCSKQILHIVNLLACTVWKQGDYQDESCRFELVIFGQALPKFFGIEHVWN